MLQHNRFRFAAKTLHRADVFGKVHYRCHVSLLPTHNHRSNGPQFVTLALLTLESTVCRNTIDKGLRSSILMSRLLPMKSALIKHKKLAVDGHLRSVQSTILIVMRRTRATC